MSTSTSTGTPPATSPWRIVAEREVREKLRTKSFRYSLLVMVLGVLAAIIASSVLGGRTSDDTVGVIDDTAATAVEGASALADEAQEGSTVTAQRFDDAAAAEQAVRDGDVDAALLPDASGGLEIIGDSSVDTTLSQNLTVAGSAAVLQANATANDVDLSALQQGTQVGERLLSPDADQSGAREAAGIIFVVLFLLTAITFGMTIAQSVVQEKESRVVEILVAAIPVRALLWGKVVGNTILALGQILVVVGVAVVALAATGQSGLLRLVAPAAGWGIVFFTLGFTALAGVWAVAGSLASRTEDLQSTTAPGQVLLIVPYFLAVSGGVAIKTVVSMIPIASAMVMPVRLAESSVPAWQLGVAVAGNILAIVVLVRFAARVYERTLMRTERKTSYREALSLAK